MNTMRFQHAFVLLEVLLAWAVLMLVLLSWYGWFLSGVKSQQRSWQRTMAIVAASNLLERLQVNQRNVFREREQVLWLANARYILPRLKAAYHCDVLRCQVDLTWLKGSLHFQGASGF